MAEEWGTVILKVTDENKELLVGKTSDITLELAKNGNLEAADIEKYNDAVDETTSIDGYTCLEFECSDWKHISEAIVKNAKNIELYSRVYDEYGTAEFYALTESGAKFHYSFEQGGDMCEMDGYEEEVMQEIGKWLILVPDSIKANFPSFISTENLEFDGP